MARSTKKILMMTFEYPPQGSGIANVTYALKNALEREGLDIKVLSRGGADINVATWTNLLPGLAGLLCFWHEAVNYARRTADYDFVWLHSPILLGGIRGLSSKKRVMVTYHTAYCGYYQSLKLHGINNFLPYYAIASKLENSFLRNLSSTHNATATAVAPSVADELRGNGLLLPIHIVPNGLNYSEFPRDPARKHLARLALRRDFSLQLGDSDIVLLYVGRISERKQPLLLVKTFAAMRTQFSNIHLILVGTGNLLPKVKDTAERIENVHVLGYVSDLTRTNLLSAADAFISLSCYEGLSLAVLEAAAAGLPIILSDIPAHRWIVDGLVFDGYLVSSLTPYLESSKIVQYIVRKHDALSRMDIGALSWQAILRKYLDLFK